LPECLPSLGYGFQVGNPCIGLVLAMNLAIVLDYRAPVDTSPATEGVTLLNKKKKGYFKRLLKKTS